MIFIIKRNITLTFILLWVFLVFSCSGLFKSKEERTKGMLIYNQITESPIPWIVFAKSVEGREIYMLELGNGDSTTIIFGGFHGNEILGVQLVNRFAEYLYQEQQSNLTSRVILVPAVNPDGLVKAKRQNANEVDVNRNFPTSNWSRKYRSKKYFPGFASASEPETQAVMLLLEKYAPQRIISVHAPLAMVNYDGPALEIATEMAKFNNYPVAADIGYPTPGSFGTYAGKERKIPTVTLELPNSSFEEIWQANKESLWITVSY